MANTRQTSLGSKIAMATNADIATPTGVNKGDLRPGMLLRCDFSGKILAGDLPPTSELPMHLSNRQIDSLAENLNITLNPLRRTRSPDHTTNTEQPTPLSSVVPQAPRLSDEDVERIAEKLAEKLAAKK